MILNVVFAMCLMLAEIVHIMCVALYVWRNCCLMLLLC